MVGCYIHSSLEECVLFLEGYQLWVADIEEGAYLGIPNNPLLSDGTG